MVREKISEVERHCQRYRSYSDAYAGVPADVSANVVDGFFDISAQEALPLQPMIVPFSPQLWQSYQAQL